LRYIRKAYHKAIRDKQITSMEELFAWQPERFPMPVELWASILEVPEELFEHLRNYPYDIKVKMVRNICRFLDLDFEMIGDLYKKTCDKHGIAYFDENGDDVRK